MAQARRTRLVPLTSLQNPLLKQVRRAVARGDLTGGGYCVAESFHLLEEAIRSESRIHAVIASQAVADTVEERTEGLHNLKVFLVPDAIFRECSATENSQGVITLVEPPAWKLEHVFRGRPLVIVLDGIQDPGNAGAILRAAEAFGATGAIFVKGSVSPYNPKALRASAGSILRLPVVSGLDEKLACAALRKNRVDVWAAMPDASTPVNAADLRRRCALVIGSEGHGVGPALQSIATGLRIPTTRVESLNAAVAAGILVYEARRQRQAQA
ncbi:MAG: RNA methyltransferase [Acidobacteria bacterium]|nr:RNA methyltransferase [Acidobacteriota bacterium]MBI3282106.1 RNA methyltransferase [Acidobacteriota bacterium]